VEAGPVLLVNRGPTVGATFQVGAAGRPWAPLARTGRRIAAASTTPDASKRESWYLLFGLGYAHPSYSGSLEHARAQGAALSDADRFMLAMDLVGAYLPHGRRLLYGAMFNGAADSYRRSEADRVEINQYLLSASALVFANQIGAGPFLRVDLGPAFYVVERATGGVHDTEESDTGLGGLAGLGYAVPVSAETRLLLNGNCALRRVEGSTTTTLAITLGGLF
jgi:hypothetical protein